MWDWYCDILNSFQSVIDGQAVPIPPSEFAAWISLTGNIVRPEDYAILRQIDNARRDAMNEEIKRARDRQKAEAELEAAAKKGKGKK